MALASCIACAFCALAFSYVTSGDIDAVLDKELPQWSQNKSIVVTGGDSGLGLATALRVARAGTAKTIVLVCPDPEDGKVAVKTILSELPQDSTTRVELAVLDLSNRESVMHGAAAIEEALSDERSEDGIHLPVLDVLINNAGIAFPLQTKTENKNADEGAIEEHIAINYLGHFLLTHRLWPNLLAAAGSKTESTPRVVNVASITANMSYRPATFGWTRNTDSSNARPSKPERYSFLQRFMYYAQSKRAILMQTRTLHQQFETTGVSSVAAHPGHARTGIFFKMDHLSSWLQDFFATNPFMTMSTNEGVSMQLMAAFAPPDIVPSGSYVVPKYWTAGRPVLIPSLGSGSLHYRGFSEDDRAALWDASLKELGIDEFGKF